MGCGDACPIYPGKRYEDWELADPAELDLDGGASQSATRSTRRVGELLDTLLPAPSGERPLAISFAVSRSTRVDILTTIDMKRTP